MTDAPVLLAIREVTVHRSAQGLIALRVGYTVNLVTEAFSGAVGAGDTSIVDEDLLRQADVLLTALQDRINATIGLAATFPVETAQTDNWEL